MDSKKIITPAHYDAFACAAGDCPDTCCKDWDIVVDGETLEFYEDIGGDVMRHIVTDDDGDVIIKFEGGVCPFLSEDRLCAIQKKHGAQRLCATCRAFPRVTQDYTEFEERRLTLACPEAARLIVVGRDKFSFIDNSSVERSDNGYDRDYMNFLLHARFLTAEKLRSDKPFTEKMRDVLSLSEHVQQLIDDERFTEPPEEYEPLGFSGGEEARARVFELHKGLDVMDKEWLMTAVSCKNEKLPANLDEELSSLALYYVARYYLTAISSYDIITTIKRAWCAAVVCAALTARENAENDPLARALIYQKYSKEIEHSDENLDLMTDAFLGEGFDSRVLL